MNSIERTLLTLDHQIPDRVPVDLHNFLVTARLMGVSNFADFFRDGDAMAEGQIMAWNKFGHDVLIIENGTAALAEACGVQVIYMSETAPVAKEPAIKSLDEVDDLVLPDPYKDPLLSELLKLTRRVVEEIGDQAFVIGRGDQGPFSLACEIRGMSQFMLDIAYNDQPEQIHKLLDFCRQAATRYCLAQIEQGAHATSIGDSPSGPDLISPHHYEMFAYPYVKQMVSDLKRQNVRMAYHICGNSTPIIEEMVSTGADIIEIDQKADQKISKEAARGRATLLGPVDPSAIMANGTPEQVEEACLQAITNLAPGGGFILGPGCALPASTPDENIESMIETARKYPYSVLTA